jgi:SPX domain protein involved in polyphosphate accumulation
VKSDYRYEIKFVLDDFGLNDAMEWLYSRTTAVEMYDKRVVNSIYFDDMELSAVKDNLSGISDRKKLRLRWYGRQTYSEARFEVKARKGRVGSKSNYPIKLPINGLNNLNFGDITSSCIRELSTQNVIFNDHIVPMLHVSYTREYFETHQGIRITIDQDINFSDTPSCSTLSENTFVPYPRKVLEIKFPPGMKDEVANLIRPLHMTPKRHSKYLIGLALLGYAVYI